jgi:hypothetical protein
MIDAIFEAESVLADYEVAVQKNYVAGARNIVFIAANELRAQQRANKKADIGLEDFS